MAVTTKDLYVTKTGMPIDTSHAFFNIPGISKVFPTINVRSYHRLQDALTGGIIDAQEKLMLFTVGDATISIPIKQIAFHHVAQGRYDNLEWIAAFCACCNMGTAFKPVIDGNIHHFGATGVYHGMAIMRDKETGSYWEHAIGECIHGKLRGRQLETIPAQYLLAEHLLETIPSALLATANQSWFQRLLDRLMMKDFLTPEGHMPKPFRLSMGKIDERLPEMQLGLGVWINGKARFYSTQTIRAHGNALIDTLSQEKLLIYIDPTTHVPAAHRSAASSFAWEGNTLVLDTGERILNGFAQKDLSEKRPLDAPEHQFVRWFAFAFKFPDCDIYEN